MALRRRYIVLILSIILMMSGVMIGAGTQSGFGTITVTEVDFQAVDGSLIHSTLQRPNYATDINQLPGVVVIHGVIQSKEWLMAFGIELSRRGFVVLTIDANSHGNSEIGTGAGAAALDYIANLDYVDSFKIGLIGHSMGGGIAWRAIADSSTNVDALVLVGSWVNSTEMPYIPSTLIATGAFDELSSLSTDLTPLENFFGVTDIEVGITYGSFGDSSARRVVLPRTNHLFETIDSVIVSESIDWMKEGLKDGIEDSYWIPSGTQIYSLWLVGGFIGLLGVILTAFPMLAILIDISPFQKVKGFFSTITTVSNKTVIVSGTIYAAIGIGTFFPFNLVGFMIPFPQSYGSSLILWFLGSGIISFVVLKLIRLKRPQMVSETKQAPAITPKNLVLTALLAGIVSLWIYACTLAVDVGLALDFRCFLPGFNDLTVNRALMVPFYFIPFLVYFYVEGDWFGGVMRTKSKDAWTKTHIHWTVKGILIKSFPYFFLIIIQYGYGLLTGIALLPGMIGFSFLFFYAFAPWFVISTVIVIWGHHLTGKYWLGAIVNALLFSWIIASMLPIAF